MAIDPVIQTLMDLIEPPDDGDQARPTSDFGSGRRTGSSPHGGFDMNRGRGVQPHGRVMSPVSRQDVAGADMFILCSRSDRPADKELGRGHLL